MLSLVASFLNESFYFENEKRSYFLKATICKNDVS